MGGGLTLKPGREHMLYSEQLPLTKNNQGISHREDDTPTFWPYSTTSTITFFFNQVFKWLPFHIKRYVCNEGSVSFSWIGIWLKAIASSFYVFLLPLLILSRSFSFTEFKREKKHSQVSTTQRQYLIFQANYPGKFAWLSQAKLHVTQEYWLIWVTQTKVVHRAKNCSSTLLKIHLSKKPFPKQMCFPRPSHTPVGL